MRFLSTGAQGANVVQLQQMLNTLRFPCGREDGIFGPATEAAVIAFQKSHNILYDGIVGPETMTSLDMASDKEIHDAKEVDPTYNMLKSITGEQVSQIFPLAPIRSIEAHFPIIKEALLFWQLTDIKSVVVALSTIASVSNSLSPHEEQITRFNTSPGGLPFDLYDYRRDMGNEGAPDGERFKSRGFCVLRGRFQYQRLGQLIGIGDQLIDQPDQVSKVSIASKILACLIENQEKNIKSALLYHNLQSAYLHINHDMEGFDRFRATYRKAMLLFG